MRKSLLRKRLTGYLLSLAMLALATPGFAENRGGGFTISPYLGGYTYDHDQSYQNLEISPIYGLRLGYNFNKNWGVEGRFGYALAESRDDAHFQEADVYSYGIDALFHWNVTPNFVPFLAAGLGGIHHNYPASGFGYYPEYAANYGVGIKYFVADNVALRADVRHIILPDDKLQNLEYTAGVTFMIGGERPPVAPVQAQAMPECPPPAPVPVEVRDTTAPYVTLVTPLDRSADASTGTEVRVAFSEPIDPATINTNTITLYQDKMPVQGAVSAPTSTSASFKEANALAPNTLYTGRVTTGVKDLAGNPMANDYVWSFKTAATPAARIETKKTTETRYISKLVMLSGTHFEFDKADLTPAGKELVQKNIQIMKDNPGVRIRIEGHTSASGSAKYNQDLSERRAKTVRTYMIEEGGIAPERLEAVGYGKTRPAIPEARPSDKESKAAKANRRVVFEIIGEK
jgi:OmpA-OmpF porin, OOP family